MRGARHGEKLTQTFVWWLRGKVGNFKLIVLFLYALSLSTIFSSLVSYWKRLQITNLRRHVVENIVTCIQIARQRLCKHIPAEAYARNNRTPISMQRISKRTLSTIESLCFLRVPCRGVIKEQRGSFELVVGENWVQFWRWQSKMVEKKWQKRH
jgi:hypothetical protein